MTDQGDHETSPLRDRIASAIASRSDEPYAFEGSNVCMEWARDMYRDQASAVIEALGLDFTEHVVHTPDGRHVETYYNVAGRLSVAGGDW